MKFEELSALANVERRRLVTPTEDTSAFTEDDEAPDTVRTPGYNATEVVDIILAAADIFGENVLDAAVFEDVNPSIGISDIAKRVVLAGFSELPDSVRAALQLFVPGISITDAAKLADKLSVAGVVRDPTLAANWLFRLGELLKKQA